MSEAVKCMDMDIDFKCIADKCRHNCCIGWEIDIDDDTLRLYSEVEGEFADRLRDGITIDEEGAHFAMLDNGRCPFLNDRNLCDIILNLGEEYLSDICCEHPRFYVERGEDYVCGYGLCCEAAAQLILFSKDEACKEHLAKIKEMTLALHKIDTCNNTIQKQDKNVIDIIKDKAALVDFAGYVLKLERMDDEWTRYVDSLLERLKSDKCTDNSRSIDKEWLQNAFCHLGEYLDFRIGNQVYSDRVLCFIMALYMYADDFKKLGDKEYLIDLCRLYSAEIEYSTENVELIERYGGKE